MDGFNRVDENGTEQQPGQELARQDDTGANRAHNNGLISGLLWCVLGGLFCSYAPYMSPLFMGYGIIVMTHGRERIWWLAAAGACVVPAVVGCLLWSPAAIVEGIAACVLALVVAALLSTGHLTITLASILTAGVTAFIIGVVALAFASQGQDVVSGMGAYLGEAVDEVAGAMGSDYQAAAQQVKGVVDVIWPTVLFVIALIYVGGAIIGANLASRNMAPARGKGSSLATFDLPAWPVIGLGVGVALLGASWVLTDWSELLFLLGVNLLLMLRPLFAIQGFGVLTGLMAHWRLGCLLQVVLLIVAINLELSFMAVSVFGLVDFWANFRRLPRGDAHQTDGATE